MGVSLGVCTVQVGVSVLCPIDQGPVITSPLIPNKDGRATYSCFVLMGAHQCGVLMDVWRPSLRSNSPSMYIAVGSSPSFLLLLLHLPLHLPLPFTSPLTSLPIPPPPSSPLYFPFSRVRSCKLVHSLLSPSQHQHQGPPLYTLPSSGTVKVCTSSSSSQQ